MVGINVPIRCRWRTTGGAGRPLFGDSHAHGTEACSSYPRKGDHQPLAEPQPRGINLGFPRTGRSPNKKDASGVVAIDRHTGRREVFGASSAHAMPM